MQITILGRTEKHTVKVQFRARMFVVRKGLRIFGGAKALTSPDFRLLQLTVDFCWLQNYCALFVLDHLDDVLIASMRVASTNLERVDRAIPRIKPVRFEFSRAMTRSNCLWSPSRQALERAISWLGTAFNDANVQ
jgi:hypothetical protein